MTYVPAPISELMLIGVAKPGVSNEERIVLRPTQSVRLADFLLAVGSPDPKTGGAFPIFDNVFWFPDVFITPPSWVLVYTGPGTSQQTTLPNGESVLTLFWQRGTTIFNANNLVPILLRPGAVVVGRRL